ncbi:MAG: HAMP domain-containing histidine kinase [Candidatus Gastranaerophilales bacterium]|nr:HAMP domain-containing histidine kinase [Candidatus Gastranaerophilales bacterium]
MNRRGERTSERGGGKLDSGYTQLKTKIFVRTMIMLAAAVGIIVALYRFFFWGRFANWVVSLLVFFVYRGSDDSYEQALKFYQVYIRNNFVYIYGLAIIVVFLIILRLYLRSFTKYFNEINRGIDALIEEGADVVALSPELVATEKKINYIKHTLEQRTLAAQAAEQRKNDLVVYLAHDLKTPLTSVIGYLTLLRDERQISEELQQKYLSVSLEKAERLEELINEFFEITRFNLLGAALEYSRVNLTRMLEQLTYEFGPMFREKNLSCTLEAEPDIMFRCDVDKMQRVFDNLLRNAVNYSFDGSEILIAVTKEADRLNIFFRNHGNTIPAEKLDRIFEQFYRLDTARGSGRGGAGLGLAIAKEIVELHAGTIEAASADETVEFRVTLPVS